MNQDIANKPIGERKPIQGDGVIVSYEFTPVVTDKTKNTTADKINFNIEIAAKNYKISRAVFISNNKVKDAGIWVSLDQDGNISINSTIASVMRFFSVNAIKDLVGKKVQIIDTTDGYLAIKAY